MSPLDSLRLTQTNTPHCSHMGPPAPALPGSKMPRKEPGVSPEDSDRLQFDEGLDDANLSDPR